MNSDYMSKRITDSIKGIAVIMMLIHHFFTFPEWYIDGISYPELMGFVKYFCKPLKMCVPVFAFLTGYFYFFTHEKSFRYSFRKIRNIYLSYWMVYIPFLVFSLASGCIRFSFSNMILEFLALKRPIMYFCWYVPFYALAMLLLPILTKNESRSPFLDTILLLIFPVFGCVFFMNFLGSSLVRDIIRWFPCVAAGYLCSKYSLFGELDRLVDGFRGRMSRVIFYAGLVCVTFVFRYFSCFITLGSFSIFESDNLLTFSMDVILAPLFVYGCAKLLYLIRESKITDIIAEIGKKSLPIWFIHCIFFNCCKEITQG